MATPLTAALGKIRHLIGKHCAIDNSVAEISMLSDQVWDVMVFDWTESDVAESFIDEFGDYFVELEWVDDSYQWVKPELIPFAFVGPADGEFSAYPNQILGAILFFDLSQGDGNDCPVLAGWPDCFDLERVSASIVGTGIVAR